MAIPADIKTRPTGVAGSDVANLFDEYNKMATVLRILTAKLDLDAGVTGTDYAALVTAIGATSPALLTR